MLTTSLSITHCCAPSMTSAAIESACWLHGLLCAEESVMGEVKRKILNQMTLRWRLHTWSSLIGSNGQFRLKIEGNGRGGVCDGVYIDFWWFLCKIMFYKTMPTLFRKMIVYCRINGQLMLAILAAVVKR